MKTVVVTASIVNAMFGMFVVGLFLFTSDNPGLVLVLGLSLIAQGGYTLWYISKRNDSTETWATKLLLGGQTVALLVGLGGFSVSTISQLTMNVDHPEYGPMAVAGLIAFQATATLYLFAVRGGAVRITSPNGT